jgi:hypothetical protein
MIAHACLALKFHTASVARSKMIMQYFIIKRIEYYDPTSLTSSNEKKKGLHGEN